MSSSPQVKHALAGAVENGIMQHKLLLGSTALVSAGILMAVAAPAKADIEVVLGGYTEFLVQGHQEHDHERWLQYGNGRR